MTLQTVKLEGGRACYRPTSNTPSGVEVQTMPMKRISPANKALEQLTFEQVQKRQYHRDWRKKNSEKIREYNTRPDRRRKHKDHMLRAFHGIGIDEFEALLQAQNGVCAICCKPEDNRGPKGDQKYLAVDHDHATGKVRGLLCDDCNNGLGRFKDAPDLLEAALAYLETHL